MNTHSHRGLAWAAIGLLFLALVAILAYKAYRIYTIGQRTAADLQRLRELPLSNRTDPTTARALSNTLASLQTDLDLARVEFTPLFPITRTFTWLPRFSTEVVYAEQILDAASALLETGRAGLDAAIPALELLTVGENTSLLDQIPAILRATSTPMRTAEVAFERYQKARDQIPVDRLDPLTQTAFKQLDDLTPILLDAFEIYPEVPSLLGLPTSEPELSSFNTILDNRAGATYLLIFQNEDELRASGGFVTAIGTLTVKNGKPTLGTFTDSPTQDDLSKIYPPPPWWLKRYMRSDYLLLRDANWEIDFPAAALSMAQLYGYYDPTPLSGVIALDQQAIVSLLRFTGPVEVTGFAQPISADNLIDQLRAAKSVDAVAFGGESGQRKAFLAPIAAEVMAKMLDLANTEHAKDLSNVISLALDRKQILVSFFTPGAQAFTNQHGWNGSVAARPNMDTLMVVDSNVGFNKTNALVDRAYRYSVELSNSVPVAELVVTHTHNGGSESPCQQWGADNAQSIAEYPMERCYYNYLRVVTNKTTRLVASSTHSVSGLLIGTVPAQVDELSDRLIGARVWGTLMALPGHESITNTFQFALPEEVVVGKIGSENGEALVGTDGSEADQAGKPKTYSLMLFKQPGAKPEQVAIVLRLPAGAEVVSTTHPEGASVEVADGLVTISFTLEQDELVTVAYR